MTFETWLFHPNVQAIGWALLHFLWQGAVLAAILAIVNSLTRQSKLRYTTGCAVLLLMPVVFLTTALSTDLPVSKSSTVERLPIQHPNPTPPQDVAIRSNSTIKPAEQFALQTEAVQIADPPLRSIDFLPGGAVALWLIGFVALSIYTACGWRRAQLLRRRGLEQIDSVWFEILTDLKRRLQVSTPVRLYVSAIAQVPTVIGWLRPYILLPISAITGLSEPQLRAVLAHELAHIRRHDYLINLVQNAIEALLFYHPAVWWVSRCIREERENCCDDLAVAICGDVMVYAGALAQLEEFRANISEPALAATGGSLLARIRRLMNISDKRQRVPGSLGAVLAAALGVSAVIGLGSAIHAQSDTTLRFEVADVHRSARPRISQWSEITKYANETPFAGRYDLRRKTILELIENAYDIDADKVLGGPRWVEFTQFDIAAKAPPSTTQESLKLMLRTLLAERFKLLVHKETKPIPAFVLTIGNESPKLKQADGSDGGGCQTTRQSVGQDPQTLACRNMTMEAFGRWLHRAVEIQVAETVIDKTGLRGAWDFEFKLSWSQISKEGRHGREIFGILNNQLGLKLELQEFPTPVLVIDRVNENPTDNPPDVGLKLPPQPTKFEVASIKPTDPKEIFQSPVGKFSFSPSGHIQIRGMRMDIMIATAWDLPWSGKVFDGASKWVHSARFDLVAKTIPGKTGLADIEFRRMLRALLIDRFRMVTHEELLAPGYELVAANPKLRKADPSNRASCWDDSGADIGSPLSRSITCRNATMMQFADQLRLRARDYTNNADVIDATGVKGVRDFTVNFSPASMLQIPQASGDAAETSAAVAADPNGAVSLFDALKKQLGLKLEMRKRMSPMLVIDHMEEKPTEN